MDRITVTPSARTRVASRPASIHLYTWDTWRPINGAASFAVTHSFGSGTSAPLCFAEAVRCFKFVDAFVHHLVIFLDQSCLWLGSLMWVSVTAAASSGASDDGWWDMSSFWPDMIVGAGTGLLIGVLLSVFEWWRGNRSRRTALSDQQTRAAETAAQLLSPSFVYAGGGASSLVPSGARMESVSSLISGVPSGVGSRLVPGFEILSELSRTHSLLRATVENIATRVAEYEREAPTGRVAYGLYEAIGRAMTTGDQDFMGWWEIGSPPPADLAPVSAKLETDFDFRDDVRQYLYNRRLLDRGREGFLIAWGGTGARAHLATSLWLGNMVDGKHHWPNNLIEERRLRKAQKLAAAEAEREGAEYVSDARGGC